MRRSPYLVSILCVLLMTAPYLPAQATPSTLSTFTNGLASVAVALESRPAVNSSLSVSLPWDAEVSSAALRLGPGERADVHTAEHAATAITGWEMENLTLDGIELRLNRSTWSWGQDGASLGEGCDLGSGVLDDGFRLAHSNPPLSAAGGGVWEHSMALTVSETGGVARTNQSLRVHMPFNQGEVRNPWKELRVCDAQRTEVPSSVGNATFTGGWCTGAELFFVLPSLPAHGQDTPYIYYGNPSAEMPSYDRQVFFADSFPGPDLAKEWGAAGQDGFGYECSGELTVNGTAASTAPSWSGLVFDLLAELPAGFSLQASMSLQNASGTGHVYMFSLVQDAQNSISFGVRNDSADPLYTPSKCFLSKTQAGVSTLMASADAPGTGAHLFRLVDSGGTYGAYVDEVLLGSVALGLAYPKVELLAAAKGPGDSLNVSFDELIAYNGYSSIEVQDPAPAQQSGQPEEVGYKASASLTSPLLENPLLLPYGLARLDAELPAGTACQLSVVDKDNATLAEGLDNADAITVLAEQHPSIRLRAHITTTDCRLSPRLLSWGIGEKWEASLGASSSSTNISIGPGGLQLARTPANWSKRATAALNLGIASTFDGMGVARPCVLRAGGGYRMYYAGYDGARWRIGLATSSDGQDWTRSLDNPVLVPGTGWDSSQVDWPYVVYNSSGYQMWYAGSNDGGASYSIGYAASRDGIRWSKGPEPVMSKGAAGSWNSQSVHAPRVLYDGSSYRMWYAGRDATVSQIGMAVSSDGLAWTNSSANPVLGPISGWATLAVLPGALEAAPDGGYSMWFSGQNSTFNGTGYATSADGENWTALPDPVLKQGAGTAIDGCGALHPSALFSSTGFMWYSAYNGTRWRIGTAQASVYPEGELLSMPVDLTTVPATSNLTSSVYIPANASLVLEVRTSANGTSWGSWIRLNQSAPQFKSDRFLQWRARLWAGTDGSPMLQALGGQFKYYQVRGHMISPEISISDGEELRAGSALAVFRSGGLDSVVLESSTDGGASWTILVPSERHNLSGAMLAFRVELMGNGTSTPRLSTLTISYEMALFPVDLELDLGGNGTADWSAPGVLGQETALPDLAAPLNAYLEAHRDEPGNTRTIPLALSSSAPCAVTAGGLSIVHSPKAIPNHPPVIMGTPPERAQVGELYYYRVDARDQDRRDTLTYALTEAPEAMGVTQTGEVTWLPLVRQVGYQSVTLTVSDGKVEVAKRFTIAVSSGFSNMPPRVTSRPPSSATVGWELVYEVAAEDPDSETLRFGLSFDSPAGSSINLSTGRFSWIPGINQTGTQSVEVLVSDPEDTVRHRFTVQVTAEGRNTLPVVTSVPPKDARINLSCAYYITASDADGDPITYSLDLGPLGATVSAGGLFEWTRPPSAKAAVTVVVRVSDGKGYSLHNFTLGVLPENHPPGFSSWPASLKLQGGRMWSYLPKISDPDGDVNMTFRVVSGPSGMSINASSGLLSWKPADSKSGRVGVVISVSDGIATTNQSFNLTVQPAPPPPGLLETMAPALVAIIIAAAAGGAAYKLRPKWRAMLAKSKAKREQKRIEREEEEEEQKEEAEEGEEEEEESREGEEKEKEEAERGEKKKEETIKEEPEKEEAAEAKKEVETKKADVTVLATSPAEAAVKQAGARSAPSGAEAEAVLALLPPSESAPLAEAAMPAAEGAARAAAEVSDAGFRPPAAMPPSPLQPIPPGLEWLEPRSPPTRSEAAAPSPISQPQQEAPPVSETTVPLEAPPQAPSALETPAPIGAPPQAHPALETPVLIQAPPHSPSTPKLVAAAVEPTPLIPAEPAKAPERPSRQTLDRLLGDLKYYKRKDASAASSAPAIEPKSGVQPVAETSGPNDDMEYLRSFLSEGSGKPAPQPPVNAPEWAAPKDYGPGLERKPEDSAPLKPSAPQAGEEHAPVRPEAEAERPTAAQPQQPAGEKGPPEEKEKIKRVPVDLDEILKDLET